jgi:hypothetical protein
LSNFKIANKTTENPNEMCFRWYCEELVEHGYLKGFEREPELISVLPKLTHKRENHFKQKANTLETFTIFQSTNYTYDYRLIWTDKAVNIFTELYEPDSYFIFGLPVFVSHLIELNGIIEIVSYIDVKPHNAAVRFGGGKMASYYTFPFIQKYLFMTKNLYINKTIPIHTGKHGVTTCLFATTFVPNRYLWTDTGKQLRKIPYRKRTLTYFANQKKAITDQILTDKFNKNSQTELL